MTTRQASTRLAAANGALFALVLCFTPLSTAIGVPWVGYDRDSWHRFVVPHLLLSGVLMAFQACAAAGRASDFLIRAVAGWIQPLTAATYLWAMIRWPGGDDGGGMSWLLIVGPMTEAGLVIAAFGARAGAESGRRGATFARTVFSAGTALGFGTWAAIPWFDVLFSLFVT